MLCLWPLFILRAFLPSVALSSGSSGIVNQLEHLLVDTGGFNDGGFKAGVTPCSVYSQGAQNLGRQTAAQWLRMSFHDFATANVAAGIGGLDASIGFETDRDENKGVAMNDSLTAFAPFVNKYASMADMIALGAITAIGACDGPLIPYKGGRKDATTAGDFGVPEEFGSLKEHLKQFARAGLDQTEMIQLTACGHTIGSVHHAGFPDVVGKGAETSQNLGGGVHFDDTHDVFDNHIATNYIDGNSSDPLVTSPNVTVRSDLRIFSSDNNATMKTLAQSNDAFLSTCTRVIAKMLNTVPKGVDLVPVSPIAIKPVNIQLSVDSDGKMTFSGAIRLLSSKGFFETSRRKAMISYNLRNGQSCASCVVEAIYNSETTKGTSLYGDTFYYLFSTEIDASKGISSYTITIYESSHALSPRTVKTFTIQDSVMWLPEFSSLTEMNGKIIGTISAAVRQSTKSCSVKALIHTPEDQLGSKNPRVAQYDLLLDAVRSLGDSGYNLYSSTTKGVLPIKNMTTASRTTVDIELTSGTQTYVDDFRELSVTVA